ncbi:radical SAM protein [archaeon]|nr:radical SAM protein [archaeon]MBL7057537.1 radical SAM protein [Candidatus Woesearchaeota archaeon]
MAKKNPIYYLAYPSVLWARPWFRKDVIALTAQRAFEINPLMALRTGLEYITKFPGMQRKRHNFAKEHGFRPPRIMVLSPSDYCQLSCEGCLTDKLRSGSVKDKSKILDYELMDSAVTQAKELGSVAIGLMGGEPLHEFSLNNVLELLDAHNDITFFIFTNGKNLNEDFIESAKKNRNALYFLSCDGIGEVSDQSRGKGSFQYIDSAINKLSAEKIPYALSFTVRANNWEHLSEIETMKYFEERGALLSLFFPYGAMDGIYEGETRMMKKESRMEFGQRLTALQDQTNMILMDYAGVINFKGCRAATGHFFINANGDVGPCFTFGGEMGNIKNDPLERIITSNFAADFRRLHEIYPNNCLVNVAPSEIRRITSNHGKGDGGTIINNLSAIHEDKVYMQDYHVEF